VIEDDSKVKRITSGWDRSVPGGHFYEPKNMLWRTFHHLCDRGTIITMPR